MNVLVTGGAGFIGSHTVVELAAAGFHPVIIDNFSNSEPGVLKKLGQITGQEIKCYEGEYQDQNLVSKVIETEDIDGVIHFAAYKAVGESVEKPISYYQNNVGGILDLLSIILEKEVGAFILSSSAAVYGEPKVKLVKEDTICSPASPYGWSKYMDEIILRDTCHANPRLKTVVLRYFNVVGAHSSGLIGELPKGRPQNLMPIIVQACTRQLPPLTVYGTDYPTPDGTCLRDYIHVVDLAKAHVAALKNARSGHTNFEVYNLGTGKPTSVLQLIDAFEKNNGIKVPYSLGPRRPGDPAAYYASPKKANEKLGWKAVRTIDDACRDAWHWQLALESSR